MKITGAMVAWDEEKLVDLAIESALTVVDDWTFVIRGDETIAKVEECIKRFGLEVSYFLKEMEGPDEKGLPVAEARFQTFDKATGDWILICDADQIFQTEGDHSVDGVLDLVRGKGSRWGRGNHPHDRVLIHGWHLVHLHWDFEHMAAGKNGPLCIPHKQLYPNTPGFGWMPALAGRDLPYGKAKRVNHIEWFMIFNCSIKCHKRYFRRLYKQQWQKARLDYELSLDDYIKKLLNIDDINAAAEDWARERSEDLTPYNGKWGLPAIIKRELAAGRNRRMWP